MSFKVVFGGIGALALLLLLIFVLRYSELEMFKFFAPQKEDARRTVFENTQSYVHGKRQDLAKYYMEYQKADAEGKETIRSVIQMQFSQFDAEHIQNIKLKQFLTNMRGF